MPVQTTINRRSRGHVARTLAWLCSSLAVVAQIMFTAAAAAEPYIGVREGLQCQVCHVSPTGGGMRTEFGRVFGQKSLAALGRDEDLWSGQLADRVSIGGNARFDAVSTNKTDGEDELRFDFDEALIYIDVNLLQNRLKVYVDERVAPGGASSREAWAMLMPKGPDGYYVRIGRFFLPFGLRIQDDGAFTRFGTGVNFDTPDDGIEFGTLGSKWQVVGAVANGNSGSGEDGTGKQWSLRVERTGQRGLIGAALNFNELEGGERYMHGVFGGIRTGPVSWIAEYDEIETEGFGLGSTLKEQVALLEANFSPAQGHNIKITGEFWEPDDDTGSDERERYSVIWEYFPIPMTQVRTGVRIGEAEPSSPVFFGDDEVFVQLHVFF